MYSIIKDVIEKGDFELIDILSKINKLWVESSLSEEERDELVNLARTNAVPDNSYAENTQQIANLWEYYQQLDARLSLLESQGTTDPKPEEEWPEYIQPLGAHDAYNAGDKIIFNSKKYICKMDGCVWDPLAYPGAWELFEE